MHGAMVGAGSPSPLGDAKGPHCAGCNGTGTAGSTIVTRLTPRLPPARHHRLRRPDSLLSGFVLGNLAARPDPAQPAASCSRSASMRARLTPRSRSPSREAERTCTTPATGSNQNSASSMKPIQRLRNSARR
jgi:hypothetical protein